MLVLVVAPLLVAVAMPFLIPFFAWKGRPRGFKRLQWVGIAIGSGMLGLVSLGFCNYVGGKPFDRPSSATDVIYIALQESAAVFLSAALGSILALFFCRSTESGK